MKHTVANHSFTHIQTLKAFSARSITFFTNQLYAPNLTFICRILCEGSCFSEIVTEHRVVRFENVYDVIRKRCIVLTDDDEIRIGRPCFAIILIGHTNAP